MKKVDILGVPIDSLIMDDAVNRILSYIDTDSVHMIFTPNAEIIVAAYRNPELKRILCDASMLTADGAGVVLASKILGRRLPAKVSGIDIMRRLFSAEKDAGLRFFFLGCKPGVAEKARDRLLAAYPDMVVAGTRHGYFSAEDEPGIMETINESGANVLLVALGAPKQEKWICDHMHQLRPNVCIGVGGAIDVFAGNVPPAPEFLRNHGLEWLYRLYCEPQRWKRMLDLPRFMLLVLAAKAGLVKP